VLATVARMMPDVAKERLIPVYSLVSSVVNTGDSVQCPICWGRFRRFLPARGRDNVQCPRCLTSERHRLLMLFLRRHTDLFSKPRKRMLHVAPEWYLQKYFQQIDTIEYLSGDIQSPRAMMRIDITALQFPDASFEVILCSHVLEHVSDDRAAMRELFRILKPGGWGILDVPIDWSREESFEDWTITTPAERTKVFGQADHVRIYGRNYPDLLRDVGFDVEIDQYEVTPEEMARFGLKPSIDHIWMCRKPTSVTS